MIQQLNESSSGVAGSYYDTGERNEAVPARYAITSYGADMDVQSLVNRIREGDIILPSFQRGYVWKYQQACRFVESLLLGLPTPSIFFAREESSEKLLVIDGHQRLTTLLYFFSGRFGDLPDARPFKLVDVRRDYVGKTYETLTSEDKRSLGFQILHATIVKQDVPAEQDPSSIYAIFQRLNTGGTSLLPQEIRAAVYRGPLNDLLHELNSNKYWRKLLGTDVPDSRMRDQEIVLRFLALYNSWKDYRQPMVAFLNTFMVSNRYLRLTPGSELSRAFLNTVADIASKIGPEGLRIKTHFNAAMFDALAVGVATRLQREPRTELTADEMTHRWSTLMARPEFIASVSKATANETAVRYRIGSAIDEFAR